MSKEQIGNSNIVDSSKVQPTVRSAKESQARDPHLVALVRNVKGQLSDIGRGSQGSGGVIIGPVGGGPRGDEETLSKVASPELLAFDIVTSK